MKIGPIPVANHLHYHFSIDILLRVDSVLGGHSRGGYESIATVGEIRVYWRADFQSGSRVLKKVF